VRACTWLFQRELRRPVANLLYTNIAFFTDVIVAFCNEEIRECHLQRSLLSNITSRTSKLASIGDSREGVLQSSSR
jgi:hypothetical protein